MRLLRMGPTHLELCKPRQTEEAITAVPYGHITSVSTCTQVDTLLISMVLPTKHHLRVWAANDCMAAPPPPRGWERQQASTDRRYGCENAPQLVAELQQRMDLGEALRG
jgi:hypothetical protein